MTVLQTPPATERHLAGDGPEHTAILRRINRALAELSNCSTMDQLVEQAPVALCRAGFDRAMISRVVDSEWQVERFYSTDEPERSAEITAAARAENQHIGPSVIELEMIRRRVSLLVDVTREPRVHRLLVEMTQSSAYVAAPVAPAGTVIGFLHADRVAGGPVTDFDREVIALFAQELGSLVATAWMRDRLDRLRRTVDGLRSSLGQIVSDDGDLAVDLMVEPRRQPDLVPTLGPVSSRQLSGIPEIERLLSDREREVLRLMALGETNGRIASRLVITEGTVKSHVRHILRKLSAANRAEAVCRWLQNSARSV